MPHPVRPDHASDAHEYIPVREISLQKDAMRPFPKRPPKADREVEKYDDYLRRKWGGTEAIPDPFDPDKLDAVLKARLSSTRMRGEAQEATEKTEPVVTKVDGASMMHEEFRNRQPEDTSAFIPDDTCCCVSQTTLSTDPMGESLNTDDDATEAYEDEIPIYKNATQTTPTENTTQPALQPGLESPRDPGSSTSDVSGRATPPRIGVGSRPPLSRSAFAKAGVPCKRCHGPCRRGAMAKGHARPPAYFPFKSKAKGGSKKSRGKQEPNSKPEADTD
ncbi:hypothetical protein F5Y14DRAFT_463474, partial [Nemania sp. NC0429]